MKRDELTEEYVDCTTADIAYQAGYDSRDEEVSDLKHANSRFGKEWVDANAEVKRLRDALEIACKIAGITVDEALQALDDCENKTGDK